ncbi:MAG: IS3 family transposase [Chitinophagaceae bacterium]|nr:MAG: IS3 family transposase [Chitinophagaceae bacterium]
MKPCDKKRIITELRGERPGDISKACRLLRTSRSAVVYKSQKDDKALMEELEKLAKDHPREGFWKCYARIRNRGIVVNHKPLHRVYKKMGLPLRRKVKKRLPQRVKEPLAVPEGFTQTWSIDFMSDVLSNGTKFRSFNVIDDFNREVLFIETDYSLKSSRVIWVLRHLVNCYGKPRKIRMDNGPEFVATLARGWSEANEIEFGYIQPGKPTQNAYIERFNKSYREGVLDAYLFDSLDEVREVTAVWVEDYNHHRPHDSLGGVPPRTYRENHPVLGLRSASPPKADSLHSAPKQELPKTKQLSTSDPY